MSTSDLLKHWDDTYKFIKEAKYVVYACVCTCVCAFVHVYVCLRACVYTYVCVYLKCHFDLINVPLT